jgi:hypothetical protein
VNYNGGSSLVVQVLDKEDTYVWCNHAEMLYSSYKKKSFVDAPSHSFTFVVIASYENEYQKGPLVIFGARG